MGLESSTRKKEFAEPDVELIENLSYEEAVQYLKKRDVLTKIDYDDLNNKLKFRAFTASRINDGQLLSRINSALIKNVKDGNGLGDFLRMTKDDLLDKVGMGPNQGWYWETVYRTNVQTAYNAGRAMGFEEDNPLALELIAIDDARTTDFCRQFAGRHFILPYDDPFWETHWPPFHFNCRSTVRAIYDEAELPDDWSNVSDLGESPAKGFGEYPVTSDSWWKELDSQVRQAKAFGLQEEIEAAREILIEEKTVEDTSDSFLAKHFDEISTEHTNIDDLAKVNPNFSTGKKEYTRNCQRCVWAYEARRRGYDVTAKPRLLTGDKLPIMNNPEGWPSVVKNFQLIDCSSNSAINVKNKMEKYLTDWGDGARAIIRVRWKTKCGGGGHVFIGENNNGIIRFLDPQSNNVNYTTWVNYAKKNEAFIMRIDNKEFSDKILLCCEKAGGSK